MNGVEPTPAERKAALLARMQAQRERWRQLKDQVAAPAAPDDDAAGDRFPRSATLGFLLAHPVLAAVAVGALIAAGPARLVRWSAWLLPLLMRR